MSTGYYQVKVYQYDGAHIPIYIACHRVAKSHSLKDAINSIKNDLKREGEYLNRYYLWATIRISDMAKGETAWGYTLRFYYDTNKLYFGGLSERS